MFVMGQCTMESGESRRVIEVAGYFFLQSFVYRNPDGLPSFTLHIASKEEAEQSARELNEYKADNV